MKINKYLLLSLILASTSVSVAGPRYSQLLSPQTPYDTRKGALIEDADVDQIFNCVDEANPGVSIPCDNSDVEANVVSPKPNTEIFNSEGSVKWPGK